MNEVKIYCLVCPVTNDIKYVGQTSQELDVRLGNHIAERKENLKSLWIDSLIKEGLKPIIVLLEIVPELMGNKVEQKWIALFESSGTSLFNNANYQPRPIKKYLKKVDVSAETYVLWKSLLQHGDLSYLAEKLNTTAAKVQYIIETRKGYADQIEIITNFFNKKAA